MLDGATKAFMQAYNGQIAVDCKSQVIEAADVTQAANDKKQLVPMVEQIEENLGEIPDCVLADNGCFSQANVEYVASNYMEPMIAPERTKHADRPSPAPKAGFPTI